MALFLQLLLATCCVCSTFAQSNYADQANNIEYQGDGLPDQATLDGRVTKLDDLSPIIFLNRTKAALNCAAGSMQVELKFNDKFYGIAYADYDRNSACQVAGKGDISYKLELPLKGCGTKQNPQRVFTNNIVVRFHPSLEMDGDEVITIVCRYPPPVTPLPAAPPAFIQAGPKPSPIVEPPLKGFQILLIICAIMFLSLLLLGLGCSYYCLRRRNMTVIRRQPFSSIEGSEITKLSGSSLGNLSMFEGLKIPRAHAPVIAAASSSGSEGPLISDTLPSDYPSESHSEIEDVDTRSIPVSSAGSFENKAYIQDNSSFYSEGYGHTQEQSVQQAQLAMVPRLPLAVKSEPRFDIQVKVKRAPPAPPSLSLSDSESSIARTERNLTTILEARETESVRTMDSPPAMQRTQFTYVPELHPPPKYIQPAPTYNRILRRQQEMQWEEPARSIASLNTEMTDTHSITEVMDDSHRKYMAPPPPEKYQEVEPLEQPIAPVHKPEITSHVVDDVFLRTITEKRTIEDIERHKRLITEYHTRAKALEDTKWDVTIKNYPVEMPEPPDWENFSDISSASGLTLTPNMERASKLSLPPQNSIDDDKLPLNSPELVGSIPNQHQNRQYISTHEIDAQQRTYLSTLNIPIENPTVPNWEVLTRVFRPTEDAQDIQDTSKLTMEDQIKWRQIITTESTLRTLLTEATVKEDFERIRHDQRYETIFEPPKWDIIIRILSPLDKPKRFRKKSDWDTRSRRSSLPTLYEYDSDGGSSLRTMTNEPLVQAHMPQSRSRKTSRSSYRSEADLRSMSEVMVDFARIDHPDSQSEASSYYPGRNYYDETDGMDHPGLARSLSQPSLARSASEFTERWVAPVRYDTGSEYTQSPDTTPKSQRSTKIQAVHLPRPGAHPHGGEMWQATASSSTQHQVAQQSSGGIQQVRTQQFMTTTEASTSFRRQQTGGGKDWFGDNDSESSFK